MRRRSIIVTFLILSLVITSPKIQSLNSDPTNESKTRRILHQPLFPATSSPPPPPPPQSNGQDQPFFHELPNSGQSQTPPQQPSQTQPTSSNAEVSNPLPSKPSQNATKKTIIASVSTILALALMLSLVAFYIHRRRTTSADGTQKLVGGNSSLVAADDEDSRMPPSNFLYIGTVEPSATTLAQETNISSPYRKLNSGKRFERYRPSPDLQPLPPLTKPPPVPPSIHSPPPMSSSDDDDDSSHDTNFYTPQGSSMSNESPRSRKSFLNNNNNISNNRSALQHSKRTSPKSSRSIATSPDKKPVIIPSIKPQPSSSLGPMQASRTLPYTPIRAKFTAPPPPPDVKRLQSLSNDDDHEMSKTATPPPPPPPPPRPPVLSAQRKLGDVKPDKKTSLSFSLSKISSPEENPWANKDTSPVDDESKKCVMGSSEKADGEERDGSKPKLKPLHWDKVRATSDRATVWDQLNSSSFQLNEDAMESLFGCNSVNSNGKEGIKKSAPTSSLDQEIRVLDPKKSQNIAILLRALNVTKEEVSEALLNGNPEGLGPELLETLVKMAPTKEEEIKLKNYNGEISRLGSAERFLKAILDIPFAFKRVEAMVYRSNFETEVNYLRSSFQTLEEASEELKNSRLFLKLLEAVLRTGNRMNDGTVRGDAKAFKLDTLLKLADVKGTDGKTTLLHFVVQEIIRSEGVGSDNNTSESSVNASNFKFNEDEFRKQGLQVVSGLSKELGNVKKAATMDSDVLSSYVIKLEMGLKKVRSIMEYARKSTQGNFFDSMRDFLNRAAEEIYGIKTEERKALSLVKDVTEYFHGDAAKEEAHPFRVFVIVRDFLSILDNVCKDVGKMQDRATVGAGRSFRMPINAQLPVLNRYNVVQNDD